MRNSETTKSDARTIASRGVGAQNGDVWGAVVEVSLRKSLVALGLWSAACLAAPASASSGETREEYLSRLRYICEVECLQPKLFQRAARKVRRSEDTELALIMDVAYVRQNGDRFELFNKGETVY